MSLQRPKRLKAARGVAGEFVDRATFECDDPMRPLLSIIIPTRNRADLAMASARQILSTTTENIEVILRDCGDHARSNKELATINDRRLIYRNAPPVSMTENWNRALELASGEYVCIIGDDDGLSSTIIPVVEWARSVHADAVVFPYAAVFYWPDFPAKKYAGRLFIGKCSGEIRPIKAKQQLVEYIRLASYVVLPRIYHGVVRRECLEILRRKTGNYFHTTALDDYLSYALSMIIDQFYYIDLPLTIAGKCGTSNSGLYASMDNQSVHLSTYDEDDRVFDRRSPPNTKTAAETIHGLVTALKHSDAAELIDTIVDGQRYASWYARSLRLGFFDALGSVRHLWAHALEDRNFNERTRILGRVGREFLRHGISTLGRRFTEARGGHPLMISGSERQSVHAARDIGEALAIVERESSLSMAFWLANRGREDEGSAAQASRMPTN